MASQVLPKGILKPSRSSHTDRASIRSPEEARQIAVQHALLLEQRKQIEQQIFSAIEALLDYPTTPRPASSPLPDDASTFKTLLRPFQPSDYDDLIEERNISGKCGYVLCPLPRRHRPGAGKFTLVNKNRADFGIVETKEVEKWCSDRCARRALYIKVQLNETAAWERIGLESIKIDLMEEEKEERKQDGDLARDIARLKIDEDAKALDAERVGENGKKIELTIREKNVTGVAKAPELEGSDEEGDGHLNIEGYTSGAGPKRRHKKNKPDDDDDDGDLIYGSVKINPGSFMTVSDGSNGDRINSSATESEAPQPGTEDRSKRSSSKAEVDEATLWRQLDALRAEGIDFPEPEKKQS